MAVCTVSGRVIDVNGSPVIGAVVGFSPDGPGVEFIDGDAVSRDERVATTGPDGTWSVNLQQGARVVIRIEEIGLHAQVQIPEQSSATLEEVLDGNL